MQLNFILLIHNECNYFPKLHENIRAATALSLTPICFGMFYACALVLGKFNDLYLVAPTTCAQLELLDPEVWIILLHIKQTGNKASKLFCCDNHDII